MNGSYIIQDNQTHHVSKEVESLYFKEDLTYILLAVMISLLSFVGILGNIPVFIVYCRRKDRKASNTFIKILAFLDLVVCAFVMPYTIVYEYHLVASDIACRLFEFLIHFAVAASNITLVAIAVERYIAVCQIGTKISVKILNRGMYSILFFGVLIAAPSIGTFALVKPSEVEDVPCSYPHAKTSGYFCHFTFTVMGKDIVIAYQIFQFSIFFVDLIVIIILYSVIYGVLWKKTQIRKHWKTGQYHRTSCSLPDRQLILNETNVVITNGRYINCGDKETNTDLTNSVNGQLSKHSTSVLNRHIEITGTPKDFESQLNDTHVKITKEKSDSKVKFNTSQNGDTKRIKATETDVIDSDSQPSKQRQSVNSDVTENIRTRRSYHTRTAKMLFLCTVIYFVTWLPFWLDIFGLTDSLLLRYIIFIGNATNPIVYGVVNKQVRASFKRLFLNCMKSSFKKGNISSRTFNTDNVSYSGTSV